LISAFDLAERFLDFDLLDLSPETLLDPEVIILETSCLHKTKEIGQMNFYFDMLVQEFLKVLVIRTSKRTLIWLKGDQTDDS
jgi:hypothetical protein